MVVCKDLSMDGIKVRRFKGIGFGVLILIVTGFVTFIGCLCGETVFVVDLSALVPGKKRKSVALYKSKMF